jgi:hypothetical protein
MAMARRATVSAWRRWRVIWVLESEGRVVMRTSLSHGVALSFTRWLKGCDAASPVRQMRHAEAAGDEGRVATSIALQRAHILTSRASPQPRFAHLLRH